jgi:hypothetical protein
MNPEASHVILITVTIEPAGGSYRWAFHSDYPHVDPHTGSLKLLGHGETQIVYQLTSTSAQSFQLIFANLKPDTIATHEIRMIWVSREGNTITLIDANHMGTTDKTPFHLRLIARPKDTLRLQIWSPDPQVTNEPNPQ